MNTPEKFETWAVVELFGHQKIAGYCTEQNVAGTNMLRVDVPATKEQPTFSRLLGSAAIYAINPVDETTARFMASRIQQKPIEIWDVREMINKQAVALPEAARAEVEEEERDEEAYFHNNEPREMPF